MYVQTPVIIPSLDVSVVSKGMDDRMSTVIICMRVRDDTSFTTIGRSPRKPLGDCVWCEVEITGVGLHRTPSWGEEASGEASGTPQDPQLGRGGKWGSKWDSPGPPVEVRKQVGKQVGLPRTPS